MITDDNQKVRVFKRSATNFQEFAKARKITVCITTAAEAVKMCREFNENLTPRQERRGTRMEWTAV